LPTGAEAPRPKRHQIHDDEAESGSPHLFDHFGAQRGTLQALELGISQLEPGDLAVMTDPEQPEPEFTERCLSPTNLLQPILRDFSTNRYS
jgi:hypothetical protein